MTVEESTKLLELIRVSYPYAYQDLTQQQRVATVRMWAASFPNVGFNIIQECFNRYRMESRYPPTVADIVHQLRRLRGELEWTMLTHRQLGNREQELHFRSLLESAAVPGDTFSYPQGATLPEYGKAPESGGFRGLEVSN